VPTAARTGWGLPAAHSAMAVIERAGQHGRGGQGQDRHQWVAAPARMSRIIDLGQVGQQVRRVGRVERVGAGQVGQGRWDRG
jgi:hypothetical protein